MPSSPYPLPVRRGQSEGQDPGKQGMINFTKNYTPDQKEQLAREIANEKQYLERMYASQNQGQQMNPNQAWEQAENNVKMRYGGEFPISSEMQQKRVLQNGQGMPPQQQPQQAPVQQAPMQQQQQQAPAPQGGGNIDFDWSK